LFLGGLDDKAELGLRPGLTPCGDGLQLLAGKIAVQKDLQGLIRRTMQKLLQRIVQG